MVRETRAAEIDRAVANWIGKGGEVWFATFTLPHKRGDSLAELLRRLQDWWSEGWSGRSAQRFRKDNRIVGMVRSVEITWSPANGWHPHIHVLVFREGGTFFDPSLLALRWRERWEQHGIGHRWVPGVSADVRPVVLRDGDSVLGGYLAKVEGKWGAGLELARGDLKRSGSLVPEQLLELASCGEAESVYLLLEFEAATKGRRFIVWSRGLREKTGVNEEISDEEAAAGPEAERVVAEWAVPRSVWLHHRGAGTIGVFLQDLVRCHGPGCHLTRVPPDG